MKDPENGDYTLDPHSPALGYGVQTFSSAIEENIVEWFELQQNYPNPFNPVTTINYQLLNSSNVNIVVYNNRGKRVWGSAIEKLQAGMHSTIFNGSQLSSGTYYYHLFLDGKFAVGKSMLLLK